MGKLIISETEKKNILSLYESTNVTPPPSESVLVANKNPFKYPEYESARRTYSSYLKDGDMFYVTDNLKIMGFLISEIKKSGNDFVKSLYNKTVRHNDDIFEILPLSKLNESEYSKNFGGSTTTHINLTPVILKNKNYSGETSSIAYETYTYTPKYSIHFTEEDFNKNFYDIVFIKESDLSDGVAKISIENINYAWKKLLSSKYKNLGMFPDEYFEIRKIQRQTTDF